MKIRPKESEQESAWELVFSSTALYGAGMVKSLLEEEEIPAIIVNKQDSSYITIVEIEVYVKRDDVLRAKQIVNQFHQNE